MSYFDGAQQLAGTPSVKSGGALGALPDHAEAAIGAQDQLPSSLQSHDGLDSFLWWLESTLVRFGPFPAAVFVFAFFFLAALDHSRKGRHLTPGTGHAYARAQYPQTLTPINMIDKLGS